MTPPKESPRCGAGVFGIKFNIRIRLNPIAAERAPIIATNIQKISHSGSDSCVAPKSRQTRQRARQNIVWLNLIIRAYTEIRSSICISYRLMLQCLRCNILSEKISSAFSITLSASLTKTRSSSPPLDGLGLSDKKYIIGFHNIGKILCQ